MKRDEKGERKMDRELFKKLVIREVEKFIEANYPTGKVEEQTVQKLNDSKEGFVIIFEDDGGPIYYWDQLLERYMHFDSFEAFIENFLEAIHELASNFKVKDIKSLVLDEIDKEYIINNVLPILINTEINRDFFDEMKLVHRDFPETGLSVIYCFNIETEEAKGTIKIPQGLIKEYEITEEELYTHSLRNLKEKNPYKELPLLSLYGYNVSPKEELTLIVAPKGFAATYILLDEVLQHLCDKYDGNIMIIPSSINEVLIGPSRSEAYINYMKKGVFDISNDESKLPKEEFLSDKLFIYDREKHQLFVS